MADATQPHTYDFNITMTCGGCSGAVDRVLKKMEGIKTYDVSLETQSAHVETDPAAATPPDYATVLEKIKRTGKTVNSGKADGAEMGV